MSEATSPAAFAGRDGASRRAWQQYAGALAQLHHQRAAATAGALAQQRRQAELQAELQQLGVALDEQRQQVSELAAAVRVPLPPVDPAPAPPPAGWSGGLAQLKGQLEAAQEAVAETWRLAQLPQLLPDWPGTMARAAVVYLAVNLPNVLLTLLLGTIDVPPSTGLKLWYVLLWPAASVLIGAALLARWGTPRLGPLHAPPARQLSSLTVPILARRHYWLGVLIAWACWLLPGALLDQLRG